MVKEIVRNIEFLKLKSVDLKPDELYIANDLIDTLNVHLENCVGMAANMIGYLKNVIVIVLENKEILCLINPKIILKKDSYKTQEGCLSLSGKRDAVRYRKIIVEYLGIDFKIKRRTFKNFEAQIVQHELDHLEGIII